MDFFTHALLPYLLASSLGLKKRMVAALVLGGVAPDLDVFFSWAGSVLPAQVLLVHRGIIHSFFFGALFGLLLLYLAALPQFRGRLNDLDLDFSYRSLGLVWAGVILHLLLDYATTRGVPLFFPWQSLRYSADLFYQIEPAILAVSILILLGLLQGWPARLQKKSIFIIFLVLLLLVGGIRMEGRCGAEEEFSGRKASIYPMPGLFSWIALQEEGDRYLISRYDLTKGTVSSTQAFPKLTAPSHLKEAEEALDAADGLYPVKIFRWRAYAVAVDIISLQNNTWNIEYYDPLVRVQRDGYRSFLRAPYESLRVVVQGGIARVAE